MSLRTSLVVCLRWHRRIGLLVALFVLLLSVTGLLLNHTSGLKLDSIKIHSTTLAHWYGVEDISPIGFTVNQQWLIHNGIESLYLNDSEITDCPPPLLGAVSHKGLLHILCHNELLLATPDGDLVERITPVLGLPADARSLAVYNQQLILDTPQGLVTANLDSLQWTPSVIDSAIDWPTAQPIPTDLHNIIEALGPGISLEQLLLDLHSGRLFGTIGVYWMDLVAILLIILAITGCIAYTNFQLLKRRR